MRNILLVEDSLLDARFIIGLLKGASDEFRWRHVGQLSEALPLLQSIRFDIILLDLNLEDSLGYETFSKIQTAAPSTAILVLSASDDEDLAIRTVREGAQDYLVKGSFDRRLLLRAIHYAYERKQAEEALRQSEATVRSIFENSLDGIVIIESQGHCLEANAAAAGIVGLLREDLIGRRLLEFLAPDQESEWLRMRTSRTGRSRFWFRREDGVKRLVDCGFSADIQPGRHLMVLHDITEHHNLEERLRQSQKMEAVGQLAGGVAHDFNNYLGIIMSYAELLYLTAEEGPHQFRAEKIMAAAERASGLTKQLLAFGRREVTMPKLLDLGMVMAEITDMVDSLAKNAAVQLKIHVQEEDLGLVRADQGQIDQVILNLARNACDAMPGGGLLAIKIENYSSPGGVSDVPAGDYVLLSVRDTGVGMEADVQSRVFEPFFTTKEPGKGTGLGLATVYGIVKQHSGHITVYSERGAGTTFNIYLPIAGDSGVEAPLASQPVRPELRGTETLLLVDDEIDLLNATADYLTGCGYKVIKARDGKEAIDAADAFNDRIDLLISDILMPNISGRALVDYIRKARPNARVLYISGYAKDELNRQGEGHDQAAFLQKPYTFQLLGYKIRELLDLRTP